MKIIGPDDRRYGSLHDVPPEVLAELEQAINSAIETTQRGAVVTVPLGPRVAARILTTTKFPSAVIVAAERKCKQAGWSDAVTESRGDDNVLLLTPPSRHG